MKFLDILKDANRNLLKNKVRTFLTILAIFIGSFTIILNTAINSGVNSFIDKQVDSVGGDGYIEIMATGASAQMQGMISGEVAEYVEDSVENIDEITKKDLEKIKEIDGIQTVRAYENYSVEYITGEKTSKKFKASTSIIPSEKINVDILAGRKVNINGKENEIILPSNYVSVLGYDSDSAAIGQTIEFGVKQTAKCYMEEKTSNCIKSVKARIVGIQAPGVMVNTGRISSNLALANDIIKVQNKDLPKELTGKTFYATAEADPSKIESIKEELKEIGFTAMTIDDEVGMIRTFLDAILVVFNIFGIIALLAAAIGIVNTLFMAVQERTREIGLMKALGLSNAKVFLSFSLEAIMLGFWGSIFGIAISMIVGYAGNTIAHETFLNNFPTFTLAEFHPEQMAFIVFIIMLIAFLAGTLPARRASKQNPIDALRYE